MEMAPWMTIFLYKQVVFHSHVVVRSFRPPGGKKLILEGGEHSQALLPFAKSRRLFWLGCILVYLDPSKVP